MKLNSGFEVKQLHLGTLSLCCFPKLIALEVSCTLPMRKQSIVITKGDKEVIGDDESTKISTRTPTLFLMKRWKILVRGRFVRGGAFKRPSPHSK